MNDVELKNIVRSYRLTVLVLSIIIISMFVLFMWVVLTQVPDTVAKTVGGVVHNEVKQAIDEEFNSRVESITQ